MAHDTRLEDWLDQWEGLLAGGEASLDEFVRRHCRDAPPGLVAEFDRKARALLSMDAGLRQMGGRSTGAGGDRDTGASGRDGGELAPGAEPVPGYRLERCLGRGGFGEVWRATGPGDFSVALKLVRVGRRVGDAERRALEVIKGVRHPHLISLFASWDVPGYLVIAMELADESLLDVLRRARGRGLPGIPPAALLRYAFEAAEALDFLHSEHALPGGERPSRLQHRDVKPHNLLRVGRSAKVADFGLVRVLHGTQTGHTGAMTSAYAAPEFFGGRTSVHSDQYCLAVTYCELRGGRLPFTGDPARLMHGHLQEEPDLTMLPAEERETVRRALAKNPADRWPSCRDFVRTLARRGAAPGKGRDGLGGREIPPPPARTGEDAVRVAARPAPTRSGGKADGSDPAPAAATRIGPGDEGAHPTAGRPDGPGLSDPEPAGGDPRRTRPAHRPRLRRAVAAFAIVLSAVVALSFALNGGLRSVLPTPAGLRGSERRGFADTILEYRDRSYKGATWRKIQDAGTLRRSANTGPRAVMEVLLTGVAGWDDGNFFITGTRWGREGVVFRCRDDRWSFLGESRDCNMQQTRQRLLDRDTLVFAGGHDVFTVSDRGTVYHDEPGGERSCFADYAEICPLGPDRLNVFYHKPGHACRVAGGRTVSWNSQDILFYLRDNAPNDRSVAFIRLTRGIAAGKVVAIHSVSSAHTLVVLEDEVWRDSSNLPKEDVADFWVYADGATPKFLVAVGDAGKLYLHRFEGETRHMTVPTPRGPGDRSAEKDLALFKVWGVSEDKFWVMSRVGAVWERAGDEWRLVVPGFTGKDQALTDAWVSPTGKVIAVVGGDVYRLD